ncbi:MAG: hypothetical protein ACK4HW_10045 [Roseinatronobacter sp.]
MKQTSLVAVAFALGTTLFAAGVKASPIENACLSSGRTQASGALCRCIGSVAQQTLTRSEQRRAARFFRDPDLAQEVRMSRSEADNAFWARYRAFGETAERYCAGR